MNSTRRTLSETLTQAQRAFLAVADETGSAPAEATDESPNPALTPECSRREVSTASRGVTKNHRTGTSIRRPEPLRSVTLRFRASVADALRRESIKRSLDYVEPFSQQAIVEAAVCSWLSGQGCRLDD